jgi:hypothetical protein
MAASGRSAVRSAAATALVVAGLLSQAGTAAAAPIEEHVPSAADRYDLAKGCFALRSEQTGAFVVKDGLGGYAASEAVAADAEPFRMQATDLGRYLFYGPTPDFMANSAPALNTVAPAAQPSDNSDWTVNQDGAAFRIVNEFTDKDLVVAAGPLPVAGTLATVAEGTGGPAGLFTFVELPSGCADYPEVGVNVSGPLPPAQSPGAPARGLVETHMHQMAFQFLGTKLHCGRPWHRFGAPFALKDCDDHGPDHCSPGAALETALSGDSCPYSTDGWPTFAGWPRSNHYTHEQSYYRWLERSWRGGLRIFVNLMVENRVLCEIYPLTPPPSTQNCNEMDSVRRQVQSIHELERYIDAQSGGPGKGWYRIVESPAEARQVIADGKLAVIKGMEVSEPFGCRLMQPGDMPMCSESTLDAGIDEIHNDLGIRQVEIVNKFDNALTGVAGDSGEAGVITNLGNFYSAGTFWDYEHCDDPENSDHSPATPTHNDDALIAGGLDMFGDATGITFPVYGPPPHCNQRGFSALGQRALNRMMSKGMIFDPDHQSVLARNQALDQVEGVQYPGVMTSHSWSTDNALPRISRLGGFIGPAAKSPQGFVAKWQHLKAHGYDTMNPYLFGLGYGADMNGFAQQGGPPSQPISYPFESPVQPGLMINQQQSGTKTYDYNVAGTAHYGLYPDWAEAVRLIGGQAIVNDMVNGAEAYLQMWERSIARGANVATPAAPAAPASAADRCAPLRAELKKAKKKKAKRKLRKKLRKQGCLPKKKKKKRKKRKRR